MKKAQIHHDFFLPLYAIEMEKGVAEEEEGGGKQNQISLMMSPSIFMQILNSMEDKVKPCRTPRPKVMGLSWNSPSTTFWDQAPIQDSNSASQSHYQSQLSRILWWPIVSKAAERSSTIIGSHTPSSHQRSATKVTKAIFDLNPP